jgi:hypothetical protein
MKGGVQKAHANSAPRTSPRPRRAEWPGGYVPLTATPGHFFQPVCPPLIGLPARNGLHLDDCPPDAKPDDLPLMIAAFQHLVSPPSGHDLGLGSVFADQQIDGSPDVEIGDQFLPIPLTDFPPPRRPSSAAHKVVIAPT